MGPLPPRHPGARLLLANRSPSQCGVALHRRGRPRPECHDAATRPALRISPPRPRSGPYRGEPGPQPIAIGASWNSPPPPGGFPPAPYAHNGTRTSDSHCAHRPAFPGSPRAYAHRPRYVGPAVPTYLPPVSPQSHLVRSAPGHQSAPCLRLLAHHISSMEALYVGLRHTRVPQ